MSNDALDTLFYPFVQNLIPRPQAGAQGVFFNAQICSALGEFSDSPLLYQQYFKPYAIALQGTGMNVSSAIPPGEGVYDFAFVLGPKNKKELHYLLACAAKLLKEGGLLIASAPNDMGGKGLKKAFEELELLEINEESKNKCRVVWGTRKEISGPAEEWIHDGGVQTILDGIYISQPGIYGWDKIDTGSEILVSHLSGDLKGAGADFGCGYGYLSDYVLKNCEDVESLVCIDADYRAISAAQQNLSIYERNVRYLWEDLSLPLLGVQGLDFIVMNPPFHEVKETDITLGKNFIVSAQASLSPGGVLYMVANAHLPYEDVLGALFSDVKKEFEGQGFKVFAARK